MVGPNADLEQAEFWFRPHVTAISSAEDDTGASLGLKLVLLSKCSVVNAPIYGPIKDDPRDALNEPNEAARSPFVFPVRYSR